MLEHTKGRFDWQFLFIQTRVDMLDPEQLKVKLVRSDRSSEDDSFKAVSASLT